MRPTKVKERGEKKGNSCFTKNTTYSLYMLFHLILAPSLQIWYYYTHFHRKSKRLRDEFFVYIFSKFKNSHSDSLILNPIFHSMKKG